MLLVDNLSQRLLSKGKPAHGCVVRQGVPVINILYPTQLTGWGS